MKNDSNRELNLAFDFVKYTNRNIFLTGKAGTGKTTFLKDLKKLSPKRMIVVAPTGVAAINAGGVTVHSFFQLPFHPFIPSFYIAGSYDDTGPDQKERTGHKMSREKVNIIKSLDLLVIDEISMVRADTLDAIDAALRRYRVHSLPFGGVQMLMIGDLQQLAPVVTESDRQIIGKYYNTPFFFGSRALCRTDYVTIELRHIYRQEDQTFINLLNRIRDNQADPGVLEELNKRYIPGFDTDSNSGYITLTTHNSQAQSINNSKLDKLHGKAHSYNAIVKDDFPEFSYPNSPELVLKEGAQVMFVKNDPSGEKLFFNGKIGKVESFDDDKIIVKCPDDDFPIMVEMAEWQNMKYTLNEETREIEETIIGTFSQYPLKLAWAITIHKSQGLTFDRAVIDARAAFAHGQVYVALSRCRTLNGLVLSSRIHSGSIIGNRVISDFIDGTVQNQPDQNQLEQSRKEYQKILLTGLFDFTVLARRINYCLKVINEHSNSILGNPGELLVKTSNSIRTDIIEVSEKFQPHLRVFLAGSADAESDDLLQERVKKASEFFSTKLEENMSEILNGISVETDSKAVKKSVNEALERLRKEAEIKIVCLNAVRSGFEISKYLDARSRAAVEIPAKKSRHPGPFTDNAGLTANPALFSLIKEWRNIKAKESDLPHYMILPQKTMTALAGLMPRSQHALRLVKGMGKKKSERFGDEILDIINAYCEKENIEPPDEPVVEKKPRKVKRDTKKISLDLFRDGKSIPEIAEERNLSITTIEGHLAYYTRTGEIPVRSLVSEEKTELIASCFEVSDDLRLATVKETLGDKVTWSEIKFVAGHLKYLRSIQNQGK
ncbi:MAG TPA: helix-turn-helix domain-containing protein [Bacteroidales bacterium]|nr:helix-turn-helix domain-containing protein [Bacteroidales bacterium]